MEFKKKVLKNGLRVILVPQKNDFTATVLVLAGTGSKYEKKEINGISHFLEHLLFKGTKKRPNALSIAEPLDRVGGHYNAFTGEEYTGYYAKVDKSKIELAIDVISDIYLNSKLSKKEIEKERNVIIEEINMYYDHPTYHIQNLWTELLYGDQPAGRDIAGTKETLYGIGRKELLRYFKSQYVTENTIVCISGCFEEKKILNKIEKYFKELKKGSSFDKEKVIEEQTSPQCVINYRKTDQTHFSLGVRGYSLFHKDRYSKEIISVILGGMMSSRLFREIREKSGLAYYVKTETSSDTDTGFLTTRAGVKNEKIEKAIEIVLREYKKMRKVISQEEISKAKEHIKGKMAISLESSNSKASFFGMQELLLKKILTPEEIYANIDKVSKKDIQRVARDIFRPENINLALIGPFKDKEMFLKMLWKKKDF